MMNGRSLLLCISLATLCLWPRQILLAETVGAPFDKPKDLPAVRYVNPMPQRQAQLPKISGQRSENVLIPSTCDLEEAARLLLENYFMSITVPELNHEPFNRGRFSALPPRLTLDIGSYLCAWPKYREALPLMRIMTGSEKGLEIDRAWADHLLKCIGPDGLYYVPRTGRPWDDVNWNGEHGAYWWKMPEDTEFYAALPLGNGRLLGSIGINYMMTRDMLWKQIGDGIVDRMNELAIQVDDMAFFPKFVWLPNEKLSQQQIDQAIQSMMDQDVEETDENTPLWQTWIITGLAQYYRSTGYQPAKDLAVSLTNYLVASRYLEEWKSHFHCIALGMQACLEVAQITGEQHYAEYVEAAYEQATSGRRMAALPQIGFFVNQHSPYLQHTKDHPPMEGCSVGDITAIAVKLAQLGRGDHYWEDADRYVRNCLIEIQRTRPDQMQAFLTEYAAGKKLQEVPIEYTELAENLPRRVVGTFAQHFHPNDMYADDYFDSCCIGNCARALYYAWESIVEQNQDEVVVRMLLNRTSAAVDIHSQIPYAGRVDMHMRKETERLSIRINDWIDRSALICKVNGGGRDCDWEENYLVVHRLKANDVLSLHFPVAERYEELKTFGHHYHAVFRGNECVDISPPGKYSPLFQRSYYRTSTPRYKRVTRFAADVPIHW